MIRNHHTVAAAALALLLGGGLSAPVAAGQSVSASIAAQQDPDDSTDRLIVKLRDLSPGNRNARIDALGRPHGVRLSHFRQMSGGSEVVRMAQRLSRAEAHALARQLARDPNVEFVEPDLRLYPQATAPQTVPNDTRYAEQWHYYEAVGGINLPAAWYVTTGSSSVVVAVIDTGVRPHAELAGRLLPGYDFIGDLATANDGGGRDTDASDPGDYGCNGNGSSWHGTHVAGTIGAASNNGVGVAGVNWTSKILPVRVLGKCGGYTSDIVDGMRWAAGIAVVGVPANPTPARVENLSLGGSGACSATFQNAINDVVARGTVVVVAAGNSNADAANTQPASCSGVVAVSATTRTGGRAGYSNYGAAVTIAAPGSGILSTLNTGSTAPVASPGGDSYASYNGTSMATPHVAGVVSLMLSLPANAGLTPAQVAAKLKSSARAFPAGTGADCTTAVCGAGIVDAYAALGATPAPTPAPAPALNLALASNGGVVTASSTYNNSFPTQAANNGDRKGALWGAGGGWNDASRGVFPDWLQVDFNAVKSIGEISVFTLQDNYQNAVEPTESMIFTREGIVDFDVQYWDGTTWQTVPGGSVTGNNKVWRKFTFTAVSTSKIRVSVNKSLASYSRIVEVEAYAASVNVALPVNGATLQASSTYNAAFPMAAVNNGDRRGANWGNGGGWNDATYGAFPDWLQVNFNGAKKIGEISVFTLQDNYQTAVEPTEAMTFTRDGIVDFDVQTWNGSAWVTLPGGSVTGNRKVWRKFTFPPVTTTGIRVLVFNALNVYSRIVEIEAYTAP